MHPDTEDIPLCRKTLLSEILPYLSVDPSILRKSLAVAKRRLKYEFPTGQADLLRGHCIL